MINRIKTKYNFKEDPKAKDEFMKVTDSTLTMGMWTSDKAKALKKNMFSLGSKNYTQQDFAKFLEAHQAKHDPNVTPVQFTNTIYNEYVKESTLAYEESKLDSLYPDFRNLMQEYRDGILLFELTDQKVWSKAVKDTVGLKSFYEANKNNYMWPERADAVVYTSANATIAKQVHTLMKTVDDDDTLMAKINKSSQLNLQVKSGKFAKGENEYVDKIPWKPGLSQDMAQQNGQVVFIKIKRVMPAGPKSLDEAKGLITADYQNQLEKEWINSLRKKYPYQVHQDVVNSLVSR